MIAIVLAGGSGKRLWPLSREFYPKQFINLTSDDSLLQQTVKRASKYVDDMIVVTNDAQYFHVKRQMNGLIPDKNILKEPVGRNTAPAIALACLHILENYGDQNVLVLPSDHILTEDFFTFAKKTESSLKDNIGLFGIKPAYPATGYGYIKTGNALDSGFKAAQFIEKPDAKTAGRFVDLGYLWNSGIFEFRISKMMDEFRNHLPELYQHLLDVDHFIANYSNIPEISIDYGIIEKSDSIIVFPYNGEWKDIGSWKSIYEIFEKNGNNNAVKGNVLMFDTSDSLVISEDRLTATIGIKDTLIVSTKDALLVADKSKAEDVKKVVEDLKKRNCEEALRHTTVYRQWGYYTVLEKGSMYKVKRLCIYPKSSISVQLHHHRAEHWIVVQGTARVVKGEEEVFLHENESIYVPKSIIHRIENPGKLELHIIEVQTGGYLEEDDIIRFDKAGDGKKQLEE